MLKLSPVKIALIYVCFGVVWITSSDLIVERLFSDLRVIIELSLFKGWLFMGITAPALYGLMRRYAAERSRSEEAVAASERKYRALIETTGTGFVILDAAGRVLDANDVYVRLTGRSVLQEIRGRAVTEWTAEHDRERNSREARTCFERGIVRDLEIDYVHRSGAIMPVEINATVIEQAGEKHILSLVRDISERRKAQEERRRNEQRFRAIFQNTPLGISIVGMDRRVSDSNPAFQRMLGYSPEELKNLTIPEISIPQDDEKTRSYFRSLLAGNIDSFTMEKRYRRKDGSVLWANLTGTLVRNELNEPLYKIGIIEDITVRKQAEEALRESEEKYRSVVENADIGIAVISPEMKIQATNPKMREWFPHIAADGGHLCYREYNAPPRDAPCSYCPTILTLRDGEVHEAITDTPADGTIVNYRVKSSPIKDRDGKVTAAIELVEDITERRKAERDVLLFTDLVNRSNDAIFVNDPATGRFLFVNDKACSNLGYDRSELLKLRTLDVETVFPDQAAWDAHVNDVKRRGSLLLEGTNRRKDGTLISVEANVAYMAKEDKEYMVAVLRDITERKKMQEALRSSRDFIDRILNTVDEAFIVIDRDYRIIMANNAYAVQAGTPVQDILGKRCHESSHGSDLPCFESGEECGVRQCFKTGEPQSCVHRHVGRDGGALYVETKAYPLKDARGAVTSAIEVINNITDRHLLEEQMLRTQKLEAVGLLAGGIAHDFNNLLQAVFGNISLAKMFSDKNGKAFGMLEDAEAAMYQATHLTKQLLTFSKGGAPVKRTIAPAVLIEQAARFALSGSNVTSRVSKAPDLWTVEADEGQLNQVIHNIVLNACEAMPDGGAISLEMRNVEIDEKTGVPLPKGRYVRIGIADTGVGIPEQHILRVFDPYFTTKQKGSGLGLATSYSIVAKHGGTITVSSLPGEGTTFAVYLPAADREEVPARPDAPKQLNGKGRVLLMDDEEVVRTVAGRMVESLGYTVELTENGDQAVERYASALRSPAPFDAVILDLTVRGGMGGKETLEMLKEMDPPVRAVVSSGYSDDAVVARYRDHGFSAVLSKPYHAEELGRVLRELLAK